MGKFIMLWPLFQRCYHPLSTHSKLNITLVVIAIAQGMGLFVLHQTIQHEFWPSNSPSWLFALYTLTLSLPTLLLLGLTPNTQWPAKMTLGFCSVTFLLAFYTGSQQSPSDANFNGPIAMTLLITMVIASFKALLYLQAWASTEPVSYPQLFRFSWRNAITLSLSLFFMGCFWALLMLWAQLFKAINIDFFWEIFTSSWFYYPALTTANALGIIILRRQAQIIDTITRIQQALMKGLLLILSLLLILFLPALLVTGLSPLWESGGSHLILWTQAAMLFIVNGVYHDPPENRPYGIWLHRYVSIAVALLSIYSLISCYGLSLRVIQHGWSLSRCFGFLIWGIFALLSFGYLWGIIRHKANWPIQLGWINTRIGLLVLVLMLLINSPLLDFRKISVSSQLNRLESGQITLDNLDIHYLYHQLGKPGYLALEKLKAKTQASNPELFDKIKRVMSGKLPIQELLPKSTEEFKAMISGTTNSIPDSLIQHIYNEFNLSPYMIRYHKNFQIIVVDLLRLPKETQSQPEYLLISEFSDELSLNIYFTNDTTTEEPTWQSRRLINSEPNSDIPWQRIRSAINDKKITEAPPIWKDLLIDGHRFQALP